MASIGNDANGRRRILFTHGGKRKTLRLGKVSKRHAETVKHRIEELVSVSITNTAPSDEVSRWLARLDDRAYGKLAATGLVRPRGVATVGAFTREYIDGRSDIKPSTRINMDRARSYLLEVFDKDKPMRDFTEGDAEEWLQAMIRAGRAENTIRKATGRIRQFWNAAIRRELASRNPFAVLPASVKPIQERFHYIDRKTVGRILAACPDDQWRLIVLLSRYGGLRTPSEILALKWEDVDWEHDRIHVPGVKTTARTIPLFPEIRPALLAAFENAEDGAEHVITRYRDTNANLRTTFIKIIKRAGLEPWEKVFQNLRSTRETELAEEYPLHVVTRWIGNSELVATKHYLQLTDEHFARAVSDGAAQNPAQPARASARTDSQGASAEHRKTPTFAGGNEPLREYANVDESLKVPEVGLEPTLGFTRNGF